VANARFRGARVIVAELEPWRVERAQQMGAALVVDPRDPGALAQIREATGGAGVDCALDCSGTVGGERLCIDAARRKGMVAFVGECGDDLPVQASRDLIRKGLTIVGSWHYNLNEFPRIMQVIRRSPLLDLLVSHTIPMSRIQEAFELTASHRSAKVILQPWE
jgi:threonine dehydrogenase-like Zn-dependent dehydrogenase